ncbi:CBS domain-containing protein CBSX5-like [Curcuma longa]|uniref:CBS domain-containing protein CBSX5-like n=1 Tax=Curcuma longa TaxID=136217 RepID=UPI003D9E16D5
MALNSLQAYVVADLCIGKPSARSIPPTATVSDALHSFRRGSGGSSENRLVVWATDYCPWKICMVDILYYLCAEENLDAPIAAISALVSVLLLYKAAAVGRRLEPDSSILEALDAIVDGARIFLAPIWSKLDGRGGGGNSEFCWLTQEDFARFFLNFIPLFSSVSALSITELALIRPASLTVLPRDPDHSALPLIRTAHSDQTIKEKDQTFLPLLKANMLDQPGGRNWPGPPGSLLPETHASFPPKSNFTSTADLLSNQTSAIYQLDQPGGRNWPGPPGSLLPGAHASFPPKQNFTFTSHTNSPSYPTAGISQGESSVVN